MTVDVAVIGAGVSGLVAAYELSRLGHRVVVLERQVRAGGSARSESFGGGFLMEHGPSTVNAASVAAGALAHALDLDRHRRDLGPSVRRRYLVRGGALHAIPLHPLGLLTANYLSLRARFRLLVEAAVAPKRDGLDESVAEFFSRRFGPEFSARVIDPLVGGLFAGDADALSMASTFPALVGMERQYGSIVRAAMQRRLRGGRMPGRRLFSWRDGIATLPRALVAHLEPSVATGVAVRRVRRLCGRFRIEAGGSGDIEARSVVIATQAAVAAQLLDPVDRDAAAAAGAVAMPPLAVVFLGYRRACVEHPLDGLGYLTPGHEGRALSGTLFASTMFAGRAPEGYVALAGYVGGARAPDLACRPAADLIDLARGEFRELLGARGEPAVARVRQWPLGLPQYVKGHGDRVAALRAVEPTHAGLFLTGNYFSGPSVGACVAEATETAVRVHRFLREEATRQGAAGYPLRAAARALAP